MLRKVIGLGVAVTASMVIVGCSNENPSTVSVDGMESNTNALLDYVPTRTWDVPDGIYTPTMIYGVSNLEILRRTSDNKIGHFRFNETSWSSVATFGTNVASDAALCLNSTNQLQAVFLQNSNTGVLAHWERSGTPSTWKSIIAFGNDCIGSPTMVRNGSKLEVVTRAGNTLRQYTKNTTWDLVATITPPASHVLVQDPVLTINSSGILVLGVYSVYNNSKVCLLVYTKNGSSPWVLAANTQSTIISNIDRWVKPAVTAFGTKGCVSILVKKDTAPNSLFEYRMTNNVTTLVGVRQLDYTPTRTVKYLASAKKSGTSMFVYYGENANLHKVPYTDDEN